MPKVSVIIPTYNRYALLVQALGSVASQQYEDFELILVDDGSTDETRKLSDSARVKELFPLLNIERFYYKRIQHSGFPGFVRNRGIEEARGEYIAFLDSDDLWMPEKLALQIAFIEKNPVRIVHTRERWNRKGKIISQSKIRHKREGDVFEDALWKCTIGPSTVLLEAGLFKTYGMFREDLEVAEDYELWLRLSCQEEVSYIDQPLVEKRAGDWDQLSEKYGQIEIFRIQALQGLLEKKSFSIEKHRMAVEVFSKKCLIYAAGCRKRGRETEAENYEALSLQFMKEEGGTQIK